MKKIYFILIISALIVSCSSDQMDDTVFISDENDRNLPAYSEWGYNSFGAVYERDYFLASNKIVPCKITYKNNQLQFLLSGLFAKDEPMALLFTFPAPEIPNIKELAQLHDYEIDLANSKVTVTMMREDEPTEILDVTGGILHFKRVQLLSIDDKFNRVILSGVFNVRFSLNDFPAAFSDGRFDVGITNDCFLAN